MENYCVGGRQRPATTKLVGHVMSKISKVVIHHCSICNRKKSITLCDKTIQAVGLCSFLKKIQEEVLMKVVKKLHLR